MVAALGSTQARTEALTPTELCQRYAASVCRFAALVSRDASDAEDLAQEALLRAIRAIDRYDPTRGTPESWLWRIVANAAHDAARRRLRGLFLVHRLSSWRMPESESVEAVALDRLRDADLHAQMRRLPSRDQTLLALRYGLGLDTSEVGHAVGLSTESAGKAIRRALARLRARMEVTGS